MRTDHSRLRRPGIAAATATLAVAGVVAGVSVAGARENVTIYSVENGATPCFSEQPTGPCGEKPVVTIQTGDKVTWSFASANGSYHNAAAKSSVPANAAWDNHKPNLQQGGSQEFTFGTAGEYVFLCQAHLGMEGTVIVEGGTVETPTPEPTEDPTEEPTEAPTEEPSATPTFAATMPPGATATPDDHLTTPAPGKGAAKDTEAPRLQSVSFKRVTRGAQLRFWLSEQSTLSAVITRNGTKAPVTSATLQVPAGTRALVLRTKALRKRGTYTLTLRGVDALGNKGVTATKTLRIK
jgi:plastocyanin